MLCREMGSMPEQLRIQTPSHRMYSHRGLNIARTKLYGMKQPHFTTKRLVLRQWCAADLAAYAEICADPEVMKFIASGAVLSPEQTKIELMKIEQTWKDQAFGTFAVESRETGEFLGAIGFSWHDFLPDVSPCVEIGWRLAKSAWNKGYATEAARGALEFGVDQLGIEPVYCFCQSENHASQRIATKIGMAFVGRVKSPSYQREIMIYQTPGP